jgi:FixJ family two-component response regulator
VVEYGGVAPIAATLGVSEATMKTHLQRLFEKTGTSRQVDLVKLTFGFADPRGGQEKPHQPNG